MEKECNKICHQDNGSSCLFFLNNKCSDKIIECKHEYTINKICSFDRRYTEEVCKKCGKEFYGIKQYI